MMNLNSIVCWLGFNGPILVIIITMYFLWERPPYFYLYIIGIFFNVGMNHILKQLIQQPRPDCHLQYLENTSLYEAPGEQYGMPSGHSQQVIYALMYLLILEYNWQALTVVSIFTAITILQRTMCYKHTVKQVLVGSILGAGVAWIFIYCKKAMLCNNTMSNKVL